MVAAEAGNESLREENDPCQYSQGQDQQQQGYGFLLVHRTTTSKPEKPAQDGRSAAPVLLSICLIVSHADAVCKAIRNATGDTLAPS